MNLPKIVSDTREEVSEKLKDRPKLASMFAQCFPNTLETTTKRLDDGTTYVFTGDIPAMWLRDSSAQLSPYIDLAVSVESTAFDAVEWSGINTEFHSTLTEVQQMVWDYHLAGQSNKWIAEAMDRSESTISEHLTNIKEAWATFIDAA